MSPMKRPSLFLTIAATALFAACATTKPAEKKSGLAKDKVNTSSATAEAAPSAIALPSAIIPFVMPA